MKMCEGRRQEQNVILLLFDTPIIRLFSEGTGRVLYRWSIMADSSRDGMGVE